MDMLEKARELGIMIKNSDEMQRMNAAEEDYNADSELLAMIDEYKAHETAAASTDDESFNEVIDKRKNELYDAVVSHPVYMAFVAAQEDVYRLMNQVNAEINYVVTGERGCSEDGCSGCTGCH
ncbi:MAG: YlbF family regulator [Eubacteriales bacterium]|jgi:cell fate (sporulation/competence/biofilm development) regulator YmcA (YheA/YmcA/DUF963 family)|nr:YlbF family regulator [Eubacteriales bacterium]